MPAGHDTFHHVRDYRYFELPQGIHLDLPMLGPIELTRFMLLQVVAGLLTLWIFSGLAKRIRSGEPARGRWWNFWETLALYIRDNVVRPTIGEGHQGHGEHGHGHDDHGHHGQAHAHAPVAAGHPADKYLPYVWTCFFYVLWCNLLGAFPWVGSPTGEINVTGALALTSLGATIFYGSKELGAETFWKALAPSMEAEGMMKLILVPIGWMIWVIEFIGLFIKHGVLAIRLFANIMAGHTVVAAILGFIALEGVWNTGLFYLVMPASIFGQLAIGLMELCVAFLQAYIFAFLSTLFIGMAVNPQH